MTATLLTPVVASSIYERMALDNEGESGSVENDIAGLTPVEIMVYYGDLDPSDYI